MRKLRAVFLAAGLLAAAGSGCASRDPDGGGGSQAPAPDVTVSAEGHTSSPWEWGPSIRMTYPFRIGQGLTLNPMGSYTYLSYDGGHENRFELGAQLRKWMGPPTAPTFWIGAEAAFAWIKDEYDGGSEDYDGPSLTALIGVPLTQHKLNPQLVGGAGISKYGGSGTGKNVRLGISITPF